MHKIFVNTSFKFEVFKIFSIYTFNQDEQVDIEILNYITSLVNNSNQ